MVDSLAFVAMPNHLHWLFQLQGSLDLPEVIRRLKGKSARAVNTQLGRTGTVWQTGFHDHALRNNEDVQNIARYVIANPLRAGIVKKIGDYALWDAVWLGALEA